jgi:lactam utilization protein B
MLAAGLRPALSIDNCPAAAGDMFATMRTAFAAQRRLDGTLRSRDVGGAVIGGEDGLQRQLAYLRGMAFRTVCVHSDNPAGVELLVGLRAALRREGMRVAPYLESR